MTLSKALYSFVFCAIVFCNFANAQDAYSREDALREEGLDWLLPFVDCTSDLLPTACDLAKEGLAEADKAADE